MKNLSTANFSGSAKGLCSLLFKGVPESDISNVSFNDPEDSEQPFAPYYDEQIKPSVLGFEIKRLESLKKVRSRSLLAIPLAIIGIGALTFAFISQMLAFDYYVGGSFVCVVGAIWVISAPITSYKSDVKSQIFPKIFQFFGDFTYSENGGLSIQSLKPSDIVPSYDTESTEDYIKGDYKGVSLELTEACLQNESRDSKGNRRTTTVFNGLFVLLSMHKNFKGKTIIKKDAGAIGNWFKKKFSKLENVQLEDPEFEKKFEVYSDDQIEARYLLTTSFMERLLKLEKLLAAKGLQASFYDDKLLIMIPSKENRFETASVFIPATFEEDINIILAEMDEIFQIVDVLKLNQNIGL